MAMEISLRVVFLLAAFALCSAEIRTTKLRSDVRPIIPFDDFGFTHTGTVEISVSELALSDQSLPHASLSQVGFFLSTRDAWVHVIQQLQNGDISCALQSHLVKPVFILSSLSSPSDNSFSSSFNLSEPGQFTLLFANCLPNLRVSMSVKSSMFNFDSKSGRRAYLSVGLASLPRIYFLFFLVYAGLAILWVFVLHRNRSTTLRIHHFMFALLVLKAINLLCEAEDKSYIERTGSAHGWDVLFYIFSFLKGITLFTLLVLIGTGWSFVKPYLQGKEKKVLMVVIPLQILANAAQVELDETGKFSPGWVTWRQVFLLVDVICCCAVLFPIVWSIKNLREAARTDGKAAVNLMKLMLFRQYYVVVICYIYFSRVIVYALTTITSYRYSWTSVVVAEFANLAFYVYTGCKFRPEAHNPYFVIDDEEEAAAAEALKLEDEYEFEL